MSNASRNLALVRDAHAAFVWRFPSADVADLRFLKFPPSPVISVWSVSFEVTAECRTTLPVERAQRTGDVRANALCRVGRPRCHIRSRAFPHQDSGLICECEWAHALIVSDKKDRSLPRIHKHCGHGWRV